MCVCACVRVCVCVCGQRCPSVLLALVQCLPHHPFDRRLHIARRQRRRRLAHAPRNRLELCGCEGAIGKCRLEVVLDKLDNLRRRLLVVVVAAAVLGLCALRTQPFAVVITRYVAAAALTIACHGGRPIPLKEPQHGLLLLLLLLLFCCFLFNSSFLSTLASSIIVVVFSGRPI